MTQDPSIPENRNNYPPQDNNDEIDLVELLQKIWLKRAFILKMTGIFLLAGLFVALFSPVKYTAHCTVVPQSSENSSGSNLGGLASMMGVNLGTGASGSETLAPNVYPQIAKSVPFAREIMQTPIRVERSKGEEITLYDYYTDKQYQSFNLLSAIRKYTMGLPGLLVGALRGNDDETLATTDSLSLPLLSMDEERVYRAIQSSLQLNLNQKEGYVTIDYTFPEAEAAAQITENIRKTLERYVIDFKSEKSEDNLSFVRQSFYDAKKDFEEKQNRLASFQDANRGLTTASARATEQRLRSEYDIAFTIYNELAKQLEQAKIAVKETMPVLTVIEPVVIPTEKSAPRRNTILAGFLFLGLVIGIGWGVFMQPFMAEIRAKVSVQ